MPFSLAHYRGLLQFLILVCHVGAVVISMLTFVAGTGGPFEAVAVISNILSFLILPIALLFKYINRHAEASNTRSLVTFGSLWLSSIIPAAVLTARATQDNRHGLCDDFAQDGGCTLGFIVLVLSYMAAVFAIIGFIIAYIDKLPGAVKVTPRHVPNKAPSSHYHPRFPIDVEMGDMYTAFPTRKVRSEKMDADAWSHWSDISI
ncbi:hypothetical protein BJ138DRAFT_759369 [Hygrophoropsis aurantiaca]|uniref:Uncharacterized protein n=1 Tax=Hygrophoropsis aurantiaca TaxID=72124 RepID=A0ACB8ARK1_9AGAM|nr:hypothetical protein BJ138DRAFT_759369 [Hygrophoropsis aurantiaca]